MPFAFIIVGLVMTVSAVRGTTDQLLSLLKSDLTGKGNYVYWTISILIIGAVGYIPDLKPISRAFITLVIIVLFLKAGKGGFFTEFSQALSTTQSAQSTTTNPTPTSTVIQPQAQSNTGLISL